MTYQDGGYLETHSANFSHVIDSTDSQATSTTFNFTFANLPQEMNPRPGVAYTVNYVFMDAFDIWSEYFFNGAIWLNLHSQAPSNDMVDAIRQVCTGLDGWIKRVAESMSNVMRTFRPSTDIMYNGIEFHSTIRVNWLWVSLPAALVVSSLAILMITIIRTQRSSVQAWKGSPLALLFINVDPEIRESALDQMDVYDGVRKAVGKTRVMLDNNHDGNWTFKVTRQ